MVHLREKSSVKLLLFITLLSVLFAEWLSAADIPDIANLNPSAPDVKSIRADVRKTIYTVKSKRDPAEMPALKFFRYRVKKGDTFWTILAGFSLNIDTLMTVNGLTSPSELKPGSTVYIPNMRGVVHQKKDGEGIEAISRAYGVEERYIVAVNGETPSRRYLFIPAASVSNLERSLFLGTAFASPLKSLNRTSGFGQRKDPFSGTPHFHGGIDLACAKGTAVYAARTGEVVFTGFNEGYGLLVVIRHTHGYHTYYGHLSKSLVHVGQKVSTKQKIAYSGNTGRTTGPHLHFEVRRNSRQINPGILLK
jgi:murein DD-endopeptidase MepM/ murein hydrolase activator NlpD